MTAAKSQQPRNLAYLHRDRGYRFKDRDESICIRPGGDTGPLLTELEAQHD